MGLFKKVVDLMKAVEFWSSARKLFLTKTLSMLLSSSYLAQWNTRPPESIKGHHLGDLGGHGRGVQSGFLKEDGLHNERSKFIE